MLKPKKATAVEKKCDQSTPALKWSFGLQMLVFRFVTFGSLYWRFVTHMLISNLNTWKRLPAANFFYADINNNIWRKLCSSLNSHYVSLCLFLYPSLSINQFVFLISHDLPKVLIIRSASQGCGNALMNIDAFAYSPIDEFTSNEVKRFCVKRNLKVQRCGHRNLPGGISSSLKLWHLSMFDPVGRHSTPSRRQEW